MMGSGGESSDFIKSPDDSPVKACQFKFISDSSIPECVYVSVLAAYVDLAVSADRRAALNPVAY
jgi:hypothetical protein